MEIVIVFEFPLPQHVLKIQEHPRIILNNCVRDINRDVSFPTISAVSGILSFKHLLKFGS
jgi:hypothetical protein